MNAKILLHWTMENDQESAQKKLAEILRSAYSGELAAALAYHGHANSVKDPQEKKEIFQIEADELEHRLCVFEMMNEMGVSPSELKEKKLKRIGKLLAFLCHIGGWYWPMYGAGRLEVGNVGEYEEAASLAQALGHEPFVDDLLKMAEVEWDHEKYFHDKTKTHWLYRFSPRWKTLTPREDIRKRFKAL